MMAKQKVPMPLPKRPEPPNLEEMLEDIGKAKDDDVVFTMFTAGSSSPSTPSPTKTVGIMSESYEEISPKQSPVDMATSGDDVTTDIDAIYQKAKTYIETNRYLQNANANLSKQYEELQNMGQHLTKSIEQLRQETSKIKH
ncbi:UPF0449 protein C19orf25 homolog [Ptychodera flava]|uniref:UPF0449 protein C19orf25 homolog n=1 Tax=Ptychodera flava TaxID=63121 RepID=UPI00396A224F